MRLLLVVVAMALGCACGPCWFPGMACPPQHPKRVDGTATIVPLYAGTTTTR